ncbi:NADPH-dependent F420 reductase [Saccharothrix sp. Mg75]|uniref:NADPH-dependent F420 reductase n=1 Tax=Saccharothrix sp. Mg75 TaxID=3445357 RepID=UPI003EEB417F
MQIGILGVGNIGATLTQRLSAAGHEVKVANSRGPETIPAEVTASGGRAVEASDVVTDVEALVVSVPLIRIPDIRPLIDGLPAGAVLLDTSNYYPFRDGRITALDEGRVESLWVAEQLGRPVVKAWNAILSGSFATKHAAAGTPGRIAIPVAADAEADRALGTALVEDTGFDGFDAGSLADSWRQQPGAPAYCTDLPRDELSAALAAAVPGRAPKRRDLAMTVISELMADDPTGRGNDFLLQVARLIYP